MYTNSSLAIIHDNDPYIGANGTKYPANFPKSEIAELFPVFETARPTDPTLIVTGYHIDGTHTQIWDTRTKTAQELGAALVENAKVALYTSDMVSIRCYKAGIAFPVEWQNYTATLRSIVSTETGTMPAQPAYPEGT
jgi:hypothetical protein